MKAVLIADRITALGFRLAGVKVLLAEDQAAVAAQFADALGDSDLVLITSPLAGQLPARVLQEAIKAASPAVQVLPVVTQTGAILDVKNLVLRSLGVAV